MQKWEYKVINIEKIFYSTNAAEEIQKMLNKMGEEGWEIIGYITFNVHMLAFKRPME